MGTVLADHADRSDRRHDRSGSGRRQALIRRDDDNEKDRHRHNRSHETWLRFERVGGHNLLCGSNRVRPIFGNAAVPPDERKGYALPEPSKKNWRGSASLRRRSRHQWKGWVRKGKAFPLIMAAEPRDVVEIKRVTEIVEKLYE